MDVSIMIEGQNGLNWPRWQRIVKLAEDLGFFGLFRSDHFTNGHPPDLDSLECWTSLTWLAGNTTHIHFGPLVTPFSVRHPALTARMAAAVDDLSGGRLVLGLGAGWQEREHHLYGFDLLPLKERFDRFEEGVEVVRLLLQRPGPQTFSGTYYLLNEAQLLPRPQRPAGPPILIGGNGKGRTLLLAAKVSSEWNSIFLTPDGFHDLNGQLDEIIRAAGRDTSTVKRSMMTGLVFGADDAKFQNALARRGNASADDLRQRGLIVGTPQAVVDQLGALQAVGLQGIMLQWLDLDDLAGIEELAKAVLGKV